MKLEGEGEIIQINLLKLKEKSFNTITHKNKINKQNNQVMHHKEISSTSYFSCTLHVKRRHIVSKPYIKTIQQDLGVQLRNNPTSNNDLLK